MLRPDVYLMQVRKQNTDTALAAIDGYDFPTGIEEIPAMEMEDCIDDENGTYYF